MNTYTVSYWTPGNTSAIASTVSVQAYDFAQEDGFLVFFDDKNRKILAVPVTASPVVVQAAAQ